MVAGRGNRHVILGTIEFLILTSKTLQLPPRIPNRAPICQYFLPDSRKRLDSLETFVSKLSLLTPRRRSKIYFATLALLLRESARPSLRLLSALNIARQSFSTQLQPGLPAPQLQPRARLGLPHFRNFGTLCFLFASTPIPTTIDIRSFLRIAPRFKCRQRHQTLSKLSARAPRFPCPRLPPI